MKISFLILVPISPSLTRPPATKQKVIQPPKPKQHLSISQFIQSHTSPNLKIGSTSAFNLQKLAANNGNVVVNNGKFVAVKNQPVPQSLSINNNKFTLPTQHILPKSSKANGGMYYFFLFGLLFRIMLTIVNKLEKYMGRRVICLL